MKKRSSDIAKKAIIAALYAALTVILLPYSFGGIQFRIAEMLLLLVFYKKSYTGPLIIGCIIANMFSPYGIIDVIFGTLATSLSLYFIKKCKNIFIASLMPSIFNAIIIGLVIVFTSGMEPFFISFLSMALGVFIGEVVVVTLLGVPVFKLLEKNEKFMELL